MKINKLQNNPILNKLTKKSESVNTEKKGAIGVKIEISNSAKELNNKVINLNDAGFTEKVEELRVAVANGQYKTNPEDIASKIMEKINFERGM